ncbi:hypothetical protein ABK046_10030, partial [Streptomyces caeruleatus]
EPAAGRHTDQSRAPEPAAGRHTDQSRAPEPAAGRHTDQSGRLEPGGSAGRGSSAGAGADVRASDGARPGVAAGVRTGHGSGGGAEVGQGAVRALYFPCPDREIPYPQPEFDVSVVPGAVIVTARTLVRDLLLQADRLDPGARADRGLVTLLPGERVTIGVSGWETPDADAARSALYCLEPSR